VSIDHAPLRAHPWPDSIGFVLCTAIAVFVAGLSKRGLELNRQIDDHIRRHNLKWVPTDRRVFSLRLSRTRH
jgi:hypothetical protein